MIKVVKRHTLRASSQKILAARVVYIADATHPDHLNKIIGTPKNYNCPDQTEDGFINEVIRLDSEYLKYREGKRGKRTKRLFEEIVYSSPYLADLTDDELDIAEEIVVAALVPDAAARSNRHKSKPGKKKAKKGRTDFHILTSAKTTGYPPTTTIWGKFGGKGKACIFPALDELDAEIARRINARRKPEHRIKSRLDVRREQAIAAKGQKPSLAQEIAEANPTLLITAKNIRATIEALGHAVPKITDRFISIIFSGAKKPRRYNLPELLEGIALAQDDGHHGNTSSPSLTPATSDPVPGAPSAPGTLFATTSPSVAEAPRATSAKASPAVPGASNAPGTPVPPIVRRRRRPRRPKPPSLQ